MHEALSALYQAAGTEHVAPGLSPRLHIICERDVGLFSLIQQVIANIPWALRGGYIPITYFGPRTCYWVPEGYQGADTVWEYYFEPIVEDYPVAAIPEPVRRFIQTHPPVVGDGNFSPEAVGYAIDDNILVCAQYGDHPLIAEKAMPIPYLHDPDRALRDKAGRIVARYIRPRRYIDEKVEAFVASNMHGRAVIGMHVRGTDAVSAAETRDYRRGSLALERYAEAVRALLRARGNAAIFVATDDESSLAFFRDRFGARVLAYDSIRHSGGEPAGTGPLGCIMPAYIAADRHRASRNGEEAVIEYLLLARCDHLVHNGSSLARTVLLKNPALPHTNTHAQATLS
ncbi:MAG: O-fucosyltransferase family protein [Alphaproteobacteria bacterium]